MTNAHFQYPLAAGSTTVRVLQWGLAGPVTLFLHGLGSNAEIWSPVASRLADTNSRRLAVDLPGHGFTSKGPDFAYTLDGHVQWLVAVIDSIGETRVDVVGSSLGGLWAAGFATKHPDRIRSLTLIGAIGMEPLALERRRSTAEQLARMDRASIADRLRRAVLDPAVISETFIEAAFRMNNSPGAAQAFAALGRYYLEGINEDVQRERLAALDREHPVLLVWGREDVTVPYAMGREAASRIPGCTLLSIDATRHVPHLERPSTVAWALHHQLRGHELPVGPIEGAEISRTLGAPA